MAAGQLQGLLPDGLARSGAGQVGRGLAEFGPAVQPCAGTEKSGKGLGRGLACCDMQWCLAHFPRCIDRNRAMNPTFKPAA